ncbi:DUF550 domain-containing protein [Salmonella enterica subsp. enterica]|nr:DUF550 domain-containing protein [Salmonella enterica subsp. enterica]
MTTITREWLQQTIAEFENTRDDIPFGLDDDDAKILIVLKRALASLERERIRREHAEWSDKTFGDVGPVGPLKHLSKEALEAAADPSDPLEWADMQFLLWDAQRRMGISDEFITRAMIEKLEINKSRQWPEPKDGEPRLHIKEQLAPVVPPAIEPDYEVIKSILPTANPDEYACCIAADMWNACRAAMLQGAEPVSQTYELPQTQFEQVADLYSLCWQSGEVVTYTTDPEKATIWLNNYSGTCVQEYTKLERLQETLSGNSPVIPDDWVMVPKEPTQAMIKAWLSEVANWRGHVAGYKAALAAAPQHEVK